MGQELITRLAVQYWGAISGAHQHTLHVLLPHAVLKCRNVLARKLYYMHVGSKLQPAAFSLQLFITHPLQPVLLTCAVTAVCLWCSGTANTSPCCFWSSLLSALHAEGRCFGTFDVFHRGSHTHSPASDHTPVCFALQRCALQVCCLCCTRAAWARLFPQTPLTSRRWRPFSAALRPYGTGRQMGRWWRLTSTWRVHLRRPSRLPCCQVGTALGLLPLVLMGQVGGRVGLLQSGGQVGGELSTARAGCWLGGWASPYVVVMQGKKLLLAVECKGWLMRMRSKCIEQRPPCKASLLPGGCRREGNTGCEGDDCKPACRP